MAGAGVLRTMGFIFLPLRAGEGSWCLSPPTSSYLTFWKRCRRKTQTRTLQRIKNPSVRKGPRVFPPLERKGNGRKNTSDWGSCTKCSISDVSFFYRFSPEVGLFLFFLFYCHHSTSSLHNHTKEMCVLCRRRVVDIIKKKKKKKTCPRGVGNSRSAGLVSPRVFLTFSFAFFLHFH